MKRNTFRVLFYVNRQKEKDGRVPLMGRVTINGNMAQFSCKLDVPIRLWNQKANRVMGRSTEADELNTILDSTRLRLRKIYHSILESDGYVTAEKVKEVFWGTQHLATGLIEAFENECTSFRSRIGKDRSIGTYKIMLNTMKHIRNFLQAQYKSTDIDLKDLNIEFIRNFSIYLGCEKNLKESTIWLHCMWLKSVVTHAHQNGWIETNPFSQFHVRPKTESREYLTDDELERLLNHPFLNPTLDYVRDIFLFACFTALSFSDIKKLQKNEIMDINGEKWIISTRQKTKVPVQVKLLDIPKKILNKYISDDQKLIFNNLNYWLVCKKIKTVMQECHIYKNISFHCARHTFGTFALSHGMPIESVSRILGHTNITTTQIYAKITMQKISKDIDSLEKAIKDNLYDKHRGNEKEMLQPDTSSDTSYHSYHK